MRQFIPSVYGRRKALVLADDVRLPVEVRHYDEVYRVMYRIRPVGQCDGGGRIVERFPLVPEFVECVPYIILDLLRIPFHGFLVVLGIVRYEYLVVQVVASVRSLDHRSPVSGTGDAERHAVSVAEKFSHLLEEAVGARTCDLLFAPGYAFAFWSGHQVLNRVTGLNKLSEALPSFPSTFIYTQRGNHRVRRKPVASEVPS